jgi:CheY-like chemotaxis protein
VSDQKIMVIDDDPAALELAQEAVAERGLPVELEAVTGGAEAIVELRFLLRHPTLPRPCLIVVDLNMPSTSGLEVLTFIKSHPGLDRIRTVVLTSWPRPGSRELCLAAGADEFLIKPDSFAEFADLLARLVGASCR